MRLILTEPQAQQIRYILGYYDNSVSLFLRNNIHLKNNFASRADVDKWFGKLKEMDNFKSELLVDYIIFSEIKNSHDLLMTLVKLLKLKRKEKPISQERRDKFHKLLCIVRAKYETEIL